MTGPFARGFGSEFRDKPDYVLLLLRLQIEIGRQKVIRLFGHAGLTGRGQKVTGLQTERFRQCVELVDENVLPSGFYVGQRRTRHADSLGQSLLGEARPECLPARTDHFTDMPID